MHSEARPFLATLNVRLDVVHQELVSGPGNLATLFLCTYDGLVYSADIHLESTAPALSFPLPVYRAAGGVAYIAGDCVDGVQYVVLWSYESELVVISRTLMATEKGSRQFDSNTAHKVVPFVNGTQVASALSFQPGTGLCFVGTHEGRLYTVNAPTGEVLSCNYQPGLPIRCIACFGNKPYTLNQAGALQARDEVLVRAAINAFAIGEQYVVYGSFSVFIALNTRLSLSDESSSALEVTIDSPISVMEALKMEDQSLFADVAKEIQKQLSLPTSFTPSIPDPAFHRDYEHFLIGTISGDLHILQVCRTAKAKKIAAVLYKIDICPSIKHDSKIVQILNYTQSGLMTVLFDDSSVARYSLVPQGSSSGSQDGDKM